MMVEATVGMAAEIDTVVGLSLLLLRSIMTHQ